jgi:mannose-6-phosphate isomerase
MELYPIKFKPILFEKIWGGEKLKNVLSKDTNLSKVGESWELSGIEGNESIVSNGFLEENSLKELIEIYMAELVGEKIYEKFGLEFPLLCKYIDAEDVLSIQVHPDDVLSKERHNAYGKTEMWYVLDADKDAEIITGFNQELSKETYLEKFNSGQLKELLNIEKTKAGDVFFIPSGRVHAIGKGILLAEIQQTSDVTYRIYDWDRTDDEGNPRELHTELAVDAFDYKYYSNYKTQYKEEFNQAVNLEDCRYFTTNILNLDKSIETDYSLLDSFIVYMCVEGLAFIELNNGTKEKINLGETVLIPAITEQVKISPVDKVKLLEVYIKPENI